MKMTTTTLNIKDESNKKKMDSVSVSTKKINLLVCFVHAHTGGAMTSLVNFVNALDLEKYDIDIMFYEMGNERYGIKEEINIIPQGKIHRKHDLKNVVSKLFSPRYFCAAVCERYFKTVKKNKRKAVQIMSKQGYKYSRELEKEYDIAIAYEMFWPLNYVMNRVKAKKKVIWEHLEYSKAGLDFFVDKKELDGADAIVFVSRECMEQYCIEHPQHAYKTHYLPNILPARQVRSRGQETVNDLPFKREKEQFIFVTVSRVHFEDKGLDRAAKVFGKLKREGKLNNVRWLIVGDGSDLPALRMIIEQENLLDIAFPIGRRDNPIPYLKEGDAFLLTSRHDAMPMSVTEALIMGLVPVVTEYSSARKQIRDGVDGVVFDNDDNALYLGLMKILQNPKMLDPLRVNIRNTDYGNEKDICCFDAMVTDLLQKR